MYRTDDPYADFDTWDRERQERLERLPRCANCEEHIQQEKAVCINGDYYCDECLDDLREYIGDD